MYRRFLQVFPKRPKKSTVEHRFCKSPQSIADFTMFVGSTGGYYVPRVWEPWWRTWAPGPKWDIPNITRRVKNTLGPKCFLESFETPQGHRRGVECPQDVFFSGDWDGKQTSMKEPASKDQLSPKFFLTSFSTQQPDLCEKLLGAQILSGVKTYCYRLPDCT